MSIPPPSLRNWRWFGREAGPIKAELDLAEPQLGVPVKTNRNRSVYQVRLAGQDCYLKLDHPASWFPRLRACFFSKARSELQATEALLGRGVPTVVPLAWGKRGCRCALLTQAVPQAVNARDFWFAQARDNPTQRKSFLTALEKFVRRFLAARAIHPDFHLGNLLVVPGKPPELLLVDPYGVKVDVPSFNAVTCGVRTLLVSFRDTLSYTEAGKLLVNCGLAPDEAAGVELWRRFIREESADCRWQWRRRRKKILSGKSRHCHCAKEASGGVWYIRKDDTGKPFVAQADFADPRDLSKTYNVRKVRRKEAERFWLSSFRLEFLRIAHLRPIAWFLWRGGDLMLWERPESRQPATAEVEEFLRRCADSGVAPLKGDYKVVSLNGRPALASKD